MRILIFVFFGSLLLGQLGGISPWPGVVVYVHDFILASMVLVCGKRSRVFLPAVFFIAAALLSLAVNLGQFPIGLLGIGSLYLVRWILYALLYGIVIQNYLSPLAWLGWVYAVGVGFGFLGIMQFFLYPDLRNLVYLGWDPHFYRLFSTLLDPNFAGIIFVLTLICGWMLWAYNRHRRLIAAGECIAFVSLLLTYSRSSYLAFAAALVLWAILQKQWKIILGVVVFAAIVFILPRTAGDTLSLFRTDSTFARVGSWKEGVSLFKSAPVFGHGFDTLRYLSPSSGDIVSKSAAGIDSSILFIGATTGLIGLAAYGYLIFSMIRLAHPRMRLGYLVSLAALGVHSLFVNSMFYPWVLIWVWILTGVMEKTTVDR